MTLILDGADVAAACDLKALVDAIEAGLAEQHRGEVTMPDRMNVPMPNGMLRLMPVVLHTTGVFGFKAFHWTPAGARYLVNVYDLTSGELLAMVDADYLTAARTGATAAVAAKSMARPDAHSVAVIGSGFEARTNLASMVAVRDVRRVSVFSPRHERREEFAAWARDRLGLADVLAHPSAEDCVRDADVVIVATNTGNAADPIAYRGDWAEPGVHISSIGSTLPTLRELDTATFARADRLVVDSPSQMADECGDVITAIAAGVYRDAVPLHDVVGGAHAGRARDDEVTLFKSVGAAMQDVLAALVVYRGAVAAGRGREVDFLSVKSF